MKFVTYNPANSVEHFLNTDFDRFFQESWPDFRHGENPRSLYPRVNIVENEAEFNLMAEVPGWKENDIDLEIKDGVLHLGGQVKEEVDTPVASYRIREFRAESFARSFRLGEQVDPERVSAKLENGILSVTLGKKEAVKPKKVAIKIAS